MTQGVLLGPPWCLEILTSCSTSDTLEYSVVRTREPLIQSGSFWLDLTQLLMM